MAVPFRMTLYYTIRRVFASGGYRYASRRRRRGGLPADSPARPGPAAPGCLPGALSFILKKESAPGPRKEIRFRAGASRSPGGTSTAVLRASGVRCADLLISAPGQASAPHDALGGKGVLPDAGAAAFPAGFLRIRPAAGGAGGPRLPPGGAFFYLEKRKRPRTPEREFAFAPAASRGHGGTSTAVVLRPTSAARTA